METLIINGGNALRGSVEINGAKNSAVAILPAAVLASNQKCIIDNIPDIEDVHCLERILLSLGCAVKKLNNNINIHGIIVQLPIPAHLDSYTIINNMQYLFRDLNC